MNKPIGNAEFSVKKEVPMPDEIFKAFGIKLSRTSPDIERWCSIIIEDEVWEYTGTGSNYHSGDVIPKELYSSDCDKFIVSKKFYSAECGNFVENINNEKVYFMEVDEKEWVFKKNESTNTIKPLNIETQIIVPHYERTVEGVVYSYYPKTECGLGSVVCSSLHPEVYRNDYLGMVLDGIVSEGAEKLTIPNSIEFISEKFFDEIIRFKLANSIAEDKKSLNEKYFSTVYKLKKIVMNERLAKKYRSRFSCLGIEVEVINEKVNGSFEPTSLF